MPSVRPRHLNNRGLTLIEVMISLVVFAILTVIFGTSVPLAHKAGKVNGQYAQAISLCQHKIDQLRAVGYGRVTSYTELSDAGIIDGNPTSQPYSFTGADEVATYLPSPTTTLKVQDLTGGRLKITVTITWKTAAYQRSTATMSLSAIIANVE